MKNKKFDIKKIIIISLIVSMLIIGIILIIIFTSNRNYINNLDFYLNGNQTIEIEEDTDWYDPLFVANYKEKSVTDEVIINNKLDTTTPGVYEITYTIKKGFSSKELKRIITVKEKKKGLTLSLNGNDVIYISNGSEYIEPGYIAMCDGKDISNTVIVDGVVNSNVDGEYIIKYKVNYNIYEREQIRKINVVTFSYQIDLEDKNEFLKENNIIFSTFDSNYDYVLLPNGVKNNEKNISYKIDNNGTYKFVIYNKLGFYEEKEFIINNIDKQIPQGTCVGNMYDNETKVLVTATDDLGIKGYEYIYGINNSGIIENKEFIYNDTINEVFVNIYDKVNNKISIKCSMIDNSTITPSSYNSYTYTDPANSKKMNYWLYIPDNLTKRNSVSLMVYLHGDGSRGNDINTVNDYAYPKFIKNGQKYPFMMLAPQVGDSNWTDESTYKRLIKLVDEVVKNYNVNPNKIILTGGSSGGGGAYVIGGTYPNYFSGIVVGAGVYYSYFRDYAPGLAKTPMWVFHGTNDHISISSVKTFTEYIRSFGGNVYFKEIKGAGHNVTETTDGFNDPNLIKWIISQERK